MSAKAIFQQLGVTSVCLYILYPRGPGRIQGIVANQYPRPFVGTATFDAIRLHRIVATKTFATNLKVIGDGPARIRLLLD
jgi:hypothetical protein